MARSAWLALVALAPVAWGKKEALQMIDASATVSSATADFVAERMARIGEGRQLAIVASLGGRRVGKAQLLNSIFGCRFDDKAETGVYIAPASTCKELLVMNCACSEAQGSEVSYRRAATLAACTADVVVVSAWHTASGRATASTIDTLSALFVEQLRQASDGGGVQRSCVVMAVHGTADRAALDTARQHAEAIWASVPKPPKLASAALGDFFDIEYVCVPHHRESPAEFKEAASALAQRLAAPGAEGSLLRGEYSRAIDAENFGVLAEQIWGDACADSDDGLGVTRDQMRACHVASRALFDALSQADRKLARWRAAVGRKRMVPGFGAMGKELLTGAMGDFDAQTATCAPGNAFVRAQRQKLGAHVKQELGLLFADQVRILNAEAIAKFRELLLLTVARQGSIQEWQVQNTQTSVERWFTQRLADLVVPELALNLVPLKADLTQRLAQYSSRFANSATLQVQALQHLQEKAKEGKPGKGPRGVAVSYSLSGALRTAGTGNLQSFASYATGPYAVHMMLANDRDLPESAAGTGSPPPTLRLQPKIQFDVDV